MSIARSSVVSVCMPVYNGSDLIEESIRSVLSQTYGDFKLIICDNCSTDNTEDVVRSFSDSRIEYSRNEKNLGLVGNANRCLALADGDYVNILHHDDIMLPENLERKVSVLDKNPTVGFVHSDVGFIDEKGRPLILTKFDAGEDYIEKGATLFEKYILKMPIGASIFIGAVMARKACYGKVGGFHRKFVAVNDSMMWMSMMLHYDVACIGDRLVNYRLHNMMTSTAINDGEGLNLSGLKEHYLGSKVVMDNNSDCIHNWDQLHRKVKTAFAMRAMEKAVWLLHRGDFKQCLDYIRALGSFDPRIVFRVQLWKFIVDVINRNFRKIGS